MLVRNLDIAPAPILAHFPLAQDGLDRDYLERVLQLIRLVDVPGHQNENNMTVASPVEITEIKLFGQVAMVYDIQVNVLRDIAHQILNQILARRHISVLLITRMSSQAYDVLSSSLAGASCSPS